MKVAVISDSRRRGGAALATARAFDVLEAGEGVNTRWLVSQADGTQDARTVVFAAGGVVRRSVERLAGPGEDWSRRTLRCWARLRNRRNLLRLARNFAPDVISLHSVNQWTDAALNRTIAAELTAIAPLLWTLHDLWPLTGCDDYPEAFSDPALDAEAAYTKVFNDVAPDLDRIECCGDRLVFAAPSQWIGGLAGRVFRERLRVEHVPHGVDVKEFRPSPRDEARRALDIPDARPVVAAAATHLGARRKGLASLIDALGLLQTPVTVALIGHSRDGLAWPSNVNLVHLGHIQDVRVLRLAYSAADAFVLPSLAEMFGLVLIEAFACGTPCVGFETGGVAEIIRPGLTGELARRGDAAALAAGLKRVLALGPEQRAQVRLDCRELAEREYDVRLEARRYSEIFSELAARGR